jgi:hypothetical protein
MKGPDAIFIEINKLQIIHLLQNKMTGIVIDTQSRMFLALIQETIKACAVM